jgi:NDP-sugar pyrophosphorylase family protein
VHNGDILAEVDLAALFAAHARIGALCTLALRSSGGDLRVAFDAASGLVTDFRGELGSTDPRFLYTGVCIVAPEFLLRIPSGQPVSFVPVWLELLRAGGRIAGAVLDGGVWRDIGNIGEYMRVHADLATGTVKVDPPATAPSGWPVWRSPDAEIDPAARLTGWTWCGPGCRIGAGARVSDSVLWAGSRVEPGASVTNSVIREGMIAAGEVKGTVV